MQKHNRSVFAIAAILAMFIVAGVHAGPPDSYTNDPTDLYTSPNIDRGMAIPSGGINPGPARPASGDNFNFGVTAKPAPTPAAKETTNLLGCGGVGQQEFTSGLFNMPETFGKFQQDVNSMLAKQILAMNYIMPQTAALFDQLNNFGDKRYQIFQQGCNLDDLRKSARDEYLKACVSDAKQLQDRKDIIKKYYSDGPKGKEGDATPKEPLLTSMAYAQLWEICTNQYVSNTTAFELREKMNNNLVKEIRRVENVTKAIMPLICTFTADSDSESEEGCWQELLVPQVRICLEGSLECDKKEGAYSVNEPLVSMQRLFDTFRYVADDLVMARRVNPFINSMDRLPGSLLTQAGKEAALSIGYSTLFRMEEGSAGDKKPKISSGRMQGLDKSMRDFQIGYLNCKNPDIMVPLETLSSSVNRAMDKAKITGDKPPLPDLTIQNIREVVKLMELKTGDKEDVPEYQANAFAGLVWTALGCSANHTVPMFDPNIVTSLNTSCLPQDRYAFYSMAGYDASMAATREVYRYLNNRLKQAYSRLMVENTVLVSTTTDAKAKVPPSVNPELNRRLAVVVKDTMIPYVESQLARLDDVQNTRGEFAKRVQKIYADKSGCVYGGLGGPRSLNP